MSAGRRGRGRAAVDDLTVVEHDDALGETLHDARFCSTSRIVERVAARSRTSANSVTSFGAKTLGGLVDEQERPVVKSARAIESICC